VSEVTHSSGKALPTTTLVQSGSAPSMALTATVPHVTTPTLSFAAALAGTKV